MSDFESTIIYDTIVVLIVFAFQWYILKFEMQFSWILSIKMNFLFFAASFMYYLLLYDEYMLIIALIVLSALFIGVMFTTDKSELGKEFEDEKEESEHSEHSDSEDDEDTPSKFYFEKNDKKKIK